MHVETYDIRIIDAGDAENYFNVVEANRKELEDFFSGTVARTKTIDDTREFLEELADRVKARTFFPYGIVENSTGRIVGYIHVFNFDWNIPKAEIGFFIDKDHKGAGITSKAVSQVIDYYFMQLGFHKLFLRTHPTNKAARALAEKCGFEQEGLIRWDYKTTKGELVDLLYYGKMNR